MGMNNGDDNTMSDAEQSIRSTGESASGMSAADEAEAEAAQSGDHNEVRSVEESRADAAGDQDAAAETETDEDRTQGYS